MQRKRQYRNAQSSDRNCCEAGPRFSPLLTFILLKTALDRHLYTHSDHR